MTITGARLTSHLRLPALEPISHLVGELGRDVCPYQVVGLHTEREKSVEARESPGAGVAELPAQEIWRQGAVLQALTSGSLLLKRATRPLACL